MIENKMFVDYGPVPMEVDNEIETIKKTTRNRKATIPKSLKIDVWDYYIGEKIGASVCMCCSKEKIIASHFECGHVISEFNGGTVCIENLRPICSKCNKSVGRKNMNEFMETYGYEFPKNWLGKDIKIQRKVQNKKKVEVIVLE